MLKKEDPIQDNKLGALNVVINSLKNLEKGDRQKICTLALEFLDSGAINTQKE